MTKRPGRMVELVDEMIVFTHHGVNKKEIYNIISSCL